MGNSRGMGPESPPRHLANATRFFETPSFLEDLLEERPRVELTVHCPLR